MKNGGSPREKRLRLLKRELVAQVLGKPGPFGEAIKKVRFSWWIVEQSIDRLPGAEDDLPVPPALSTPRYPSDMHTAWAHHPDLPPGPPSDAHTVARNLERQWQNDLLYALRRGGVPERHVAGRPPYAGSPPASARLLSWLRFAAACVLCKVPVSKAPALVEVGGVPSLRRGIEGECMLGVVGPDEQEARAVARAEREAYDKLVADKLWQLGREELGDDLAQAKLEVELRFAEELQTECDRARRRAERLLELNPRRTYLIEFDPKKDRPADVNMTVAAVMKERGVTPEEHGNLPQGDLEPVMMARLLEDPDWSIDRVATVFGREISTATTYAKRGKRILSRGP